MNRDHISVLDEEQASIKPVNLLRSIRNSSFSLLNSLANPFPLETNLTVALAEIDNSSSEIKEKISSLPTYSKKFLENKNFSRKRTEAVISVDNTSESLIENQKIHKKSILSFLQYYSSKKACNIPLSQNSETDQEITIASPQKMDVFGDLSFFPEILKNRKAKKKKSRLSNARSFMEMAKKIFKRTSSLYRLIDPDVIVIFVNLFLVFDIGFFSFVIPLQMGFGVNLIRSALAFPSSFGLIGFFIDLFAKVIASNNTAKNTHSQKEKSKIDLSFLLDFLSLIYIILALFGVEVNLLGFFFIFRLRNLKKSIKSIKKLLIMSHVKFFAFSLLFLFSQILFVSHVCSCIWYFMGDYFSSTRITWLTNSSVSQEKDWQGRYLESFFFISGTLNQIGIDDIHPVNHAEKVFLSVLHFCSTGILIYMLVNIAVLTQNFFRYKGEKLDMLHKLYSFLEKHPLSHNLEEKTRVFLERKFEEVRHQNATEFVFKNLPPALNEQVLMETRWKYLDLMFPSILSKMTKKKLLHKIQIKNYLPSEILYRQNDQNDLAGYFVETGEIELYVENPKGEVIILRKIGPLQMISLPVLYGNHGNETYARSMGFSKVLKISKQDFLSILRENQEDYEKFCFLKEKISLGLDFPSNCVVCQASKHYITDCPLFSFNISKKSVISGFFHSPKQSRMPFLRRKKARNLKKNVKMKSSREMFGERFEFEQRTRKNENDGCFEISSDSSELGSAIERIQGKNIDEDKKLTSQRKEGELYFYDFEKAKKFRFFFPQSNFDVVFNRVNGTRKKLNKTFVFSGKLSSHSVISLVSIVEQTPMIRAFTERPKKETNQKTRFWNP